MQVLSATGGIAQTNSYVIADESAGTCVLIDAPDHTAHRLLDEIAKRRWTLSALWLTHGHFDHVADHAVVREFAEKQAAAQKQAAQSGTLASAPGRPPFAVALHPSDLPKLRNPGSMLFQLPFFIPAGEADVLLQDGQTLSVSPALSAEVLFTPGHSPGHVCFYFKNEKLLVGGDLIIGGAIGRTDFLDCSVPDMQASLQRVMRLPDDIRLLPGHGTPSTLGDERRTNPYLRYALEGRLTDLT